MATLRRDRDAIDGKNLHKTVDNQTGVASTVALDQACRESDILCRSLDAALCNLYRDNPEKLAAWKSAVRLERPAKTGKKAEMPEPPAAPAAPAAAPTA
ncbi:MAG: hypothetical protein JSR82_00445 [Verrucomicrobia bacterium]|nr:hypothetical protein [Verrucomicrobiota bacterium]